MTHPPNGKPPIAQQTMGGLQISFSAITRTQQARDIKRIFMDLSRIFYSRLPISAALKRA